MAMPACGLYACWKASTIPSRTRAGWFIAIRVRANRRRRPPPFPREVGFLFVRKERWGLTWRARLLLLALLIGLAFIARNHAYSFLAENEPVEAELLVVEGWLLSEDADLAATEFRRGHYQRLLIVDVDYSNYRKAGEQEPKPDPSRLLAKHGIPR